MKILSVATLLLLWNLSFAQDSLKTVRLEEVAITTERAKDTDPVSQVTLSKKQISQFDVGQSPMVTIEQLSPSIISYSDAGSGFGNYNQIRLRGMEQTRINVTLNGVPLNDMIDQGTFFSNFNDFTSSIQSVQVQRGVGITSNGTSSYAGSLSFESLNLGQDDPFGSVSVTGGSFNSFRLNAEAGTGRTADDFAVYSRISRSTSDGYKYHSGSEAFSLFFSAAKFFDNSVLKLTGLAGKSERDQAYAPVLLSDIERDPRTNYFDRDDTDDFEQEVFQLQYITFLNDQLSWNTSVYYNGSRGFFPATFFSGRTNAVSQTLYSVVNDHFGAFSNLSYEGDRISWSAGVHGYTMKRGNEESFAPDLTNPYYQDETEKNEFSAFAKLQYELTDRLTGFVDLQVRALSSTYTSDSLRVYAGNSEAERSDFFFNPKLGVNYQLSETSNLYASFGRSGREPARSDLVSTDPFGFNVINSINFTAFTNDQVIRSEYVNDWEIGYRLNSEKLQLNLNGFYMSFENEIASIGSLLPGSYFPIRRNVESSTRTGLELDLKYQANSTLQLGLITTYMQTNVEEFTDGADTFTDVEHAFAPDFQLLPSLQWTPIQTLSLGINGRYVSESYLTLSNDPSLTLPSFFVANITGSWSITEQIEVGIQLNNLFDERYFTNGAPIDGDFDGTVEGPGYNIQPPRNFFTSLKVRF